MFNLKKRTFGAVKVLVILMAAAGFRLPNNRSSMGGALDRELWFIADEATLSKLKAGVVVCRGSDKATCKESDASGNDIGFLSYEGTPIFSRPEGIDGLFRATGLQVGVDRGAGRRQRAILAAGQNVGGETPLKVGAYGRLTAGTVGTDDIIADSAEPINATSGELPIEVVTRK